MRAWRGGSGTLRCTWALRATQPLNTAGGRCRFSHALRSAVAPGRPPGPPPTRDGRENPRRCTIAVQGSSSTREASMKLLGRRAECEALDRLLTDALAGRSRVTVLRGEAGVGKSALLGYLADRVDGWHVATAVGVESEMELAYAGLHQLCVPMLDQLERLPVPQRDALATVFGLSAGPAPDRFLVGLATLTLFAEVAEQQPLIAHRRRRAVARPRLRAAPRFRRAPPARRACRARVRRTHRKRRRRPRRAPRVAAPRARRFSGARPAARQRSRPAGCGGLRADHHGEPRQPARAARIAAHLEGRRCRRRVRASGRASR